MSNTPKLYDIAGFLHRRREEKDLRQAAARIFGLIVERVRQPWYYATANVPDTAGARYGLITLHIFAVFHALEVGSMGEQDDREKQPPQGPTGKMAQLLSERFFDELDVTFRNMGTGDMGVGGKVRKLAREYYMRLTAYEKAAFGGGKSQDLQSLADEIALTMFAKDDESKGDAQAIAGDILQVIAHLGECPKEELLAGDFSFPPAPEGQAEI